MTTSWQKPYCVQKINILKYAKTQGIIYGFAGLFIGFLYSFGGLIVDAFSFILLLYFHTLLLNLVILFQNQDQP